MANNNNSPTYIGFSTVGANQPIYIQQSTGGVFGGPGSLTVPVRQGRKFVLTDEQLVIRDLLNALSIQQGQKPGNPAYGTTLWTYVYEPQTQDTQTQISNEIRRVIGQDPRVSLNNLALYANDNGIMIQVEIAFQPYNNVVGANFFLNRYSGTIQQLGQ